MKKVRFQKPGLLAAGFFAVSMAFTGLNANAQNQVAFNNASKPELVVNDNEDTPAISTGNPGDAASLSGKTKSLVLFVSGGTKDRYTAEQYAMMFRNMFKDTKYTQHPKDIKVVIHESEKDRPTMVKAYINGYSFRKDENGNTKNDGSNYIFTAAEIIPYIDKINKAFDEKNDIAAIYESSAHTLAAN